MVLLRSERVLINLPACSCLFNGPTVPDLVASQKQAVMAQRACLACAEGAPCRGENRMCNGCLELHAKDVAAADPADVANFAAHIAAFHATGSPD